MNRWWGGCMLAAMISTPGLAQYGARLTGEPVAKLAESGTRSVVLFFVASDCPISDRTFPEMKRIREQFQTQGVAVWFVYPNATERRELVAAHQRAFDAAGAVLLDPRGELVGLAGAKVTPEASVLVPAGANGWRPVYTGRVDDRFVRLGLERPRIGEHFAEEAVEAVLQSRPVPPPTGTPVGCGIVRADVVQGGAER